MIKKLFRRMGEVLSRISLMNKILLILIISSLVPQIAQMVYYYTETETNIQEEMLQNIDQQMEYKAERIERNLAGIITLSRTFLRNSELYQILERYYQIPQNYLTAYREKLITLLGSASPFYQQVSYMKVYTDNPSIVNGAFVRKVSRIDSGYRMEESLSAIDNLQIGSDMDPYYLRIALLSNPMALVEDRSISIIRELDYFPQYSNYAKVLQIDLNMQYFRTLLSELGLFDNLLLVDTSGRILFANNSYNKRGEYATFHPEELGHNILVLERKLDEFPLSLYGLYNANIISAEFEKSRQGMVTISIITMMIAVACTLVVAGNITRRIRQLVYQTQQIALGKFAVDTNQVIGNDEISIIEEGLNKMSLKLAEMIERDYSAKLMHVELERETTEAKLLALQSQIDPHFLFNALESIRLKAMSRNETETALMLKYMARMFRHVIEWDEDIIPMKENIKFLTEYLEIQKYRFGSEFEYKMEIDENAMKCYLPKLIVQPLVENACKHGVEAISNERKVRVKAFVEEGKLHIRVEDNGGGMAPKTLKELKDIMKNKEVKDSTIKGVGLKNIYQRLLLYYGEDGFTFEINSTRGQGTVCSIVIPVEYRDTVEV